MSTILKTLKKLEEEKNILDQKLDLKGMLLKEDAVSPKILQAERRKLFLIVAMTTGLLLAGGTGFYHWTPNRKAENPPRHVPSKALAQQTLLPKKSSASRTFEGVPMAAIPSTEKETAPKSEQGFTLFRQLATKPPIAAVPAPKKPLLPKPFTKLLAKEVLPPAVSTDLEEIENLIQSTTALVKNNPATPIIIQGGYIPGVKVKGIIFFDKESPSNHIIVTTQNNSNLKLRVGDPVQNAVLKSIRPNRVIFLYQGQLIEMGIGQ